MKSTTIIAILICGIMLGGCTYEEASYPSEVEEDVGEESNSEEEKESTTVGERTVYVYSEPEEPSTPPPPTANVEQASVPEPVTVKQGAAAEEIAVTGVLKDAPDKADGTPAYGITDESSITGTAPPKGYILEGDYSAYVGQRITVYGIPRQDHGMRVLDVTRLG